MNLALAFIIVAIVIFLIAAVLAFGLVSGGVSVAGLMCLGLASFAAGHLPV